MGAAYTEEALARLLDPVRITTTILMTIPDLRLPTTTPPMTIRTMTRMMMVTMMTVGTHRRLIHQLTMTLRRTTTRAMMMRRRDRQMMMGETMTADQAQAQV